MRHTYQTISNSPCLIFRININEYSFLRCMPSESKLYRALENEILIQFRIIFHLWLGFCGILIAVIPLFLAQFWLKLYQYLNIQIKLQSGRTKSWEHAWITFLETVTHEFQNKCENTKITVRRGGTTRRKGLNSTEWRNTILKTVDMKIFNFCFY